MEGLDRRVQAQVAPEIARTAEALVAHLTRMGTDVSYVLQAGLESLSFLPILEASP